MDRLEIHSISYANIAMLKLCDETRDKSIGISSISCVPIGSFGLTKSLQLKRYKAIGNRYNLSVRQWNK